MIRIALVEDEAEVRAQLQGYVQRHTRQYGTEFAVTEFADGMELLAQAQQATLDDQRLYLQTLYDTIPCSIRQYAIENGQLRLIGYNKATWEMLGYASREGYWKFTQGEHKNTHPDDIGLVQAKFSRLLAGGTRENYENQLIRQDVAVIWMQVALQRYQTGDGRQYIQAVLYDVTEQRRRDLHRYSQTLYNVFDEVFQFDFNTNFSLLLFSRYTQKAAVGQP